MSEIARLAWHQGRTQGELAKRYNEIAGTRIDSPNVMRHFSTQPRRLSQKVAKTYGQIFGLGQTYIELLMALDRGEYALGRNFNGPFQIGPGGYIGEYLEPESISSVFQKGAIDKAVALLLQDEGLARQCINEAELAWQRRLVGLLPGLKIRPKRVTADDIESNGGFANWEWSDYGAVPSWRGTGIPEEYLFKWLVVVAKILFKKCHYDLREKWASKSEKRLAAENLLVKAFTSLSIARIGWNEWLAVQAQLEMIFYRKQLPVDEMRTRLRADIGFQDWECDNNPDQVEERYNSSHQDADRQEEG